MTLIPLGQFIMTNNINYEFHLIDNNVNFNKNYENYEATKLFFLDVNDQAEQLDINIKVKEHSFCEVYLTTLSSKSKKININVECIANHAKVLCVVRAIAIDEAQVQVFCNGIINAKSIENEVAQDLRTVVIGAQAKIIGKPQLVINSNNVIASHTLNIGVIDQETIFYLMTKGLKKIEAINLILKSYFQVIIDNIKDETTKMEIIQLIDNKWEVMNNAKL